MRRNQKRSRSRERKREKTINPRLPPLASTEQTGLDKVPELADETGR
jgi:hypothetical protein